MIKLRQYKRKEPSADITPLIDVVFILLIFFMLTAVIAPPGMAVNLPEAQSVSPSAEKMLTLTLGAGDKIFLDSKPVTMEDLKGKLATVGREASIRISGDREIAYGLFVRVMDLIRQSGTHPIILSAEAKSEIP